MYNEKEFSRTVVTGLEHTKTNTEILSSILGQIGDGIWEDRNDMQKYQEAVQLSTEDSDLHVSEYYYCGRAKNPYRNMTDDEVRRYFSNKVRYITKLCLKDKYEHEVYKRLCEKYEVQCSWIIYSDQKPIYDHIHEVQERYLKMFPFVFKFDEENTDVVSYLSYISHFEDVESIVVTVADCVKAYKILRTPAAA